MSVSTGTGATAAGAGRRSSGATPFVPRLVSDWLRDTPQRRHQRLAGGLVFIDVSGFTAMSERLASLGREGAERVTEIIDGAFDRLLTEAYRQGGSLLKFGGDALLLWFEGEAAAARAAYTAHGMRGALSQVGRIETPAGAVQLRCSIGVHTGEIDFFLVGTSHRELILAGSGASAVMRAEASAGADNIVITHETALQLPPTCVGKDHGAGSLLAACPPEPPRVPLREVEPASYQWRAISTALRQHLVDEARDIAEHRRAVVGFLHFEHTDQLVAEDGPEAAADALHDLVTAVQDSADEHGLCLLASDIDIDGGKIILTAGVPVAHTDDVDRMLLGVRGVVETRPRIPIKVGVHRGPLFAGEVGPSYRRTYTVMGDVVNTAARVMSKADLYEVYVTDETLESATVRFETTSIPPFEVKGKSEPLRASSVGEVEAEEGRIETTNRALVGREHELAELLRRFDAAMGGDGSIIELIGPPGIGKTELFRALVSARGVGANRVVVVRGQRVTENVAYGAVRTATLALLGLSVNAEPVAIRAELTAALPAIDQSLDRHVPAMLQMLGAAEHMSDDIDARAFRANVAEAVDAVLSALYDDGLLLVVENAQWLDEPSTDLLRALGSSASHRPWLIGATGWPEAPELGGTRVELEPLDEFNATELALVESGHRLLPVQANVIARRAAGIPLFIVELVAIALEAGGDTDDLPASLEQLLSARIDHLPPGNRSVLRQLSVLGAAAEIDEARQYLGMEANDLERKVTELDGFLTIQNGVVRFRETLLPDAAYGGLSFRRRRELHNRAGLLLEERLEDPTSRADVLSRHFHAASDWLRSWRYSLAAARQSEARGAYPEAVAFLERAMSSGVRANARPEERGQVARLLGRNLMRIGRAAQADDMFARAAKLVDDDRERAALWIDRSATASAAGRTLAAVRRLRRALALLGELAPRDRSPRDVTSAHAGLAGIRFKQGKLVDARRHAEEAERAARTGAEDDVLGRALQLRFAVESQLREIDPTPLGMEAIERFDRAGRERDSAHVRSALGLYLDATGDLDGAAGVWEVARDTLHRLGLSMDEAVVRFNLADLLYKRGRFTEAASEYERAGSVFEALEHPYETASWIMRHCCSIRLGQSIGDVDVLERLGALRDLGQGLVADDLHAKWSECALLCGRDQDAEAFLTATAGSADPAIRLDAQRIAARLMFSRGQFEEARGAADAAVTAARQAVDVRREGEAQALLADALDALGQDSSSARQRAEELLDGLGVERGTFGRVP